MENILGNIDQIRRSKGYSQEYVATKIGMKQAGFSLIMSGERELKYNTLLKIANVFQVNVVDIITYPEKYYPVKDSTICADAVLQIRLDGKKKEEILRFFLGTDFKNFLK